MVLVLVLPVLLTGFCQGERKRDFVLALWRHGARSPMEFSSQIGDTLETWPQGPGQLTQYGVELHQELGHFLKDRYSDLFPDDIYRRKDIYIRSTDRDRTLESAMANVGAFLNVKTPGYIPFPVHTLPTEMDNLLRYPNENCKRYSQIKQEISDTPKMRELNQIYHEDIVRMAELVNASTSMTIQNMWPVIDSIDCHIYNNKTDLIPTDFLTDEEFLTRLRQAAAFGMMSLFTDMEKARRIEVSRLQGGVLLGDILSQLRSPLKQPEFSDPVKYLVYSAHDTTLAAALVAMNTMLDPFAQPFYASALLFEKYDDDSVEIFYRNGTDFFKDLTEETCGVKPCSLMALADAWRSVIPESRDAECHNMDPSPELQKRDKAVTALCIILTISWGAFLLYFLYNRGKLRSGDRLALIDSEFSMETDKWASVPASSFSNPSI